MKTLTKNFNFALQNTSTKCWRRNFQLKIKRILHYVNFAAIKGMKSLGEPERFCMLCPTR